MILNSNECDEGADAVHNVRKNDRQDVLAACKFAQLPEGATYKTPTFWDTFLKKVKCISKK